MNATVTTVNADLIKTPLHALHQELNAKMVPFSGYEMPVQYPSGILAEHRHTRQAAGLFDVSHMGQILLKGPQAAMALETLVPVDVQDMAIGKQRYAFFTDERGGILDDLMITRRPQDILLIVNAGCKLQDLAHLQKHLRHRCEVEYLADQALLALQGPQAVEALSALDPKVAQLGFMAGDFFTIANADCFITRSGYTGEDGFEISVPGAQAQRLANVLLAQPQVQPIGLGARDTLRLEAGLCLYGHDITTDITPIEAGLTWAMQKIRRPGGERAGGYPGAALIEQQLTHGCARKRVGLISEGRVPVREGTPVEDEAGQILGTVCSGTLSPMLNQPIAMAYLPMTHTEVGTRVVAIVRDKRIPMTVTAMPFIPHRYHR